MINPLTFILACAFIAWCSTGGVSRRVCFKENKGRNCRAPIKSSLNQIHAKNNSFDCCSLPEAIYYANTSYTKDQIAFFGVRCFLCGKSPSPVIPSAGEGNPCERTVCSGGKVCINKNGRGKCVCRHCKGVQRQPVCGTDWVEYHNECELKRHACRERRMNVEVAYDGRCKTGCDNVVCRKNRTCMVDRYKKAYCVSCVDCSKYSRKRKDSPVCGADGVQYTSSCHLRMETCRQGKTIGLAYKGKCIANATCSNINCDTGSRRLERKRYKKCVNDAAGRPRCVTCSCEASENSPASSPVCGTDNRTYKNHCRLRQEMCETTTFIDVKHLGPCTGDLHSIPSNDQACPQATEKPCEYQDLGMYYVTVKQFASILKNDFNLNVTRSQYNRKDKDEIILMKLLIQKLSKKFRKARERTP